LRAPNATPVAEYLRHANIERVRDQEFFSEFYLNLKPIFSRSLGALCWKGKLELIDGSRAEVLAVEHSNERDPFYSITITGQSFPLSNGLASYGERTFKSARHAVLHLERDMNRELFRNKKD
jgi:hypothetical protein